MNGSVWPSPSLGCIFLLQRTIYSHTKCEARLGSADRAVRRQSAGDSSPKPFLIMIATFWACIFPPDPFGLEVVLKRLFRRGEIAHHQVKAAPNSCWASASMHLKYFVCECVLNHTFLLVWSSEKYSLLVWFLGLLAGYHECSTRRRVLARREESK